MKVFTKTGKELTLSEPPMAQGGEGAIYAIKGYPKRVAKIYLRAEDAAARRPKIEAMTSISGKFAAAGELEDVAWPLGALYADKGGTRFVGFGMRRISSPINIDALYEYPPLPGANFSMADKLEVAASIARVTKAVHEAGQVVGDYNDNNVRVLPGNKVALVDVDSFHARIGDTTYRCPVCMPGYVAPEVLAVMHGCKSYDACPHETFTEKTDDWALAVHLFRILFNGAHPYHCLPMPDKSGSVPAPLPVDKRVERGETPFFKRVAGVKLPPYAPDVNMLPGYLKQLFVRAFVEGHDKPERRPSAAEWEQAMVRYRAEVRQTCNNEAHWHAAKTCPYCKADERAGLNQLVRAQAPQAAAAKATAAGTTTSKQPLSPFQRIERQERVNYWVAVLAAAVLASVLAVWATPLATWAYTALFGSAPEWMLVVTAAGPLVSTSLYSAKRGARRRQRSDYVLACVCAVAGLIAAGVVIVLVKIVLAILTSEVFWGIVVVILIIVFLAS